MASVSLATMLVLMAIPEWTLITSGEDAKTSVTVVQEMHSVDIDPSPVQLLHRVKRADLHDHSMLEHSASGHHGNGRRGNQKHRDPTPPSIHQHPTLSADKPLVRRKRIRREGTTPSVTGYQAPALQQAVVTTHRHPPANLRRSRSKTKPKRTRQPQKRKSVRKRGNRHTAPKYEMIMTLDPRNQRYSDHFIDRKTTKLVKERDGSHRRKHTARDQRPLMVSDRHHIYHPRSGKPLKDHRVSVHSRADSVVDEFRVHPRHPVAVHRVDVSSRSRAPASGSGQHRRRLPVVRKAAASMSHDGVSSPLKHVLTEFHRRRAGPLIRRRRNSDRKKKLSGRRSKRSRGTKQLVKSSHRTLRQISQPLMTRSSSTTSNRERLKRRRLVTVYGRHG